MEFSGDGQNPRLDLLGIGQELRAQMRAGTVRTDKHVARRGRPVFKTSRHGSVWRILESDDLFAELDDGTKPFEKKPTQRDAAHGQLGINALPVALWKINGEQAIHSMIEKGHPLARFGRAVDEIFKERSRQATPERSAPGGIDTQSVALQTIRRRIV